MIAVTVALLGASELLGFDPMDRYCFAETLDVQPAAGRVNAPPEAAPEVAATCFACHGPQGHPVNSSFPVLASQSSTYIAAQLHAFAHGQRSNPIMGPIASSLREDQIRSVADYFAQQTPAPTAHALDAATERRGATVVGMLSCVACHGEQLVGKDPAPRLAGQGEAYVVEQLTAFKSGSRRDPSGAMNGIAAAIPANDIPIVASYLAAMPIGPGASGPSR